jgi:phosphohistidine swiveling domain-containing protein
MVKFGNKPYVDTRASFNSLIPEKLGKKLSSKLVNYYLDTLSKNPHLYDKVEFEILFTCYDFNLDSKLSELEKHGFTKNEIKKIKNVLLDLTNNIISDFPKILKDSQYSMQKLARNRTEIISNLKNKNITQSRYLENIEKLLVDCKKFGTLPFSIMARIGFIGSILLKSIQKDGYLPSYFENMLLNSLSTPISDIRNDVIALNDKKITKIQFLKKYGHLRPGTYDITALRYDDSKNNFFEDIQFPKLKTKHKFDFDNILLSNLLTSHFLNFENIDFFSFVRDGLIYREKLKFEFTKNLSEALELIAKVGKTLGFTREEVSNLDIRTILKSKNLSKSQTRNIWRKKIFQQQEEKLVNDCLSLPPIIFSEKDFDIIQYFISKPNYITDKKITGNIINFENFKGNIGSQKGKILLLQNADPGYDWIFTKKLGGLITKYGGVASHMSIRCSETGLPAAIGCGEVIFEKLKLASKVLLDCKNKEILILEHSKHDEIIEAKKILKSLGYIK